MMVQPALLRALETWSRSFGLGEEARAFLARGDFLGFERLDFLGAGFNGIPFGVAVDVGVGGFDDAEVVEEEGDAAGLAEGSPP